MSQNNEIESASTAASKRDQEDQSARQKNLATMMSNQVSKASPDSSNYLLGSRPFDLVIFGATGSVGKFVVEEMALVVNKYYNSTTTSTSPVSSTNASPSPTKDLRDPQQFAQRRRSVPRQVDGISWAVAGRSALKLSETLCRAELATGIKNLSSQVPVILADSNHHKSLLDMCQKCKVVINCAGPYSESGEILIMACLESGTSYVDLAHETTFIESMREQYSERAKRAGIYIINGCGFQSMSAEMGLNFTKQVADGQVEEIKIILNLNDTKAQVRQSSATGGLYAGGKDSSSSICSTALAIARPKANGIITQGMWRSLLIEKAHEVPVVDRISRVSMVPKTVLTSPDGLVEQLDGQQDDDDDETQITSTTSTALISAAPRARPKMLERKDTQALVKDIVQFRNQNSLAWLQAIQGLTQTRGRGYCFPMDSLISDEAQLIRGEMCNYELRQPDVSSNRGWRPIRCTSFMSMKSLFELLVAAIWLFVFNVLVKWSPLRHLMKTFPYITSLGYVNTSSGDSITGELDRGSLNHIKYCQTFVAYGTPSDDSGDPMEERGKHSMRKQVQLLVSRIVGPEPNHIATATFAIQAGLALLLEKDHLPSDGGVLTPGAAFSETNIIYQLRRRNIKFEVLKKA